MKKAILCLLSFFAYASSCSAMSIDEKIDALVAPASDFLSNKIVFAPVHIFGGEIPAIILWLILGGCVCFIATKGIPIWGFKHAIEVVTGKHKPAEASVEEGEVSSFQALMTALSGTVGLGNIAGVAVAVTLGGPGALVWMVLCGFLGMASKFAEATLGVKYRKVKLDGTVSGGPMYYIMYGLTKMKLRWLALPLAIFFSVACIFEAFGGGNMFQINMATQQLIYITGGVGVSFFSAHSWVFGVIIALIVGAITIGGIKSIVKITEKIVPIMVVLYLLTGLIILIVNWAHIPQAIHTILTEAFHPKAAVTGGIFGCIIWGMRRSVQANEAGVGSAPIAYSAVQSKEPVSQGFVALLEPFIATVIICNLTGLIVVLTMPYLSPEAQALTGAPLVSEAFASVFPFFPKILAIVIILFALSTLISWSYYGIKAWSFLFGESQISAKLFQLIYCVVIVIGSSMNMQSVIDFTDAMMFTMAVPNLLAIYIMMPIILKELKAYCIKYNVGIYKLKPIKLPSDKINEKKEEASSAK